MRAKFISDDKNFKCFFCCHVRTGTICIGIWHLVLHIFGLSVIAGLMLHPELIKMDTSSDPEPLDNTYRSELENYRFMKERTFTPQDLHVGLAITFGTFLITAVMVYGASKGHPGYLMPFFCLQVFDFCITTLSFIGYITYMPDIKQFVVNNPNIPFQKELLHMNDEWLTLLILLLVTLILTAKAYCIGVVWACYKYLSDHVGVETITRFVDPDTEALLPPDYDTAIKDPNFVTVLAPPPYTAN